MLTEKDKVQNNSSNGNHSFNIDLKENSRYDLIDKRQTGYNF